MASNNTFQTRADHLMEDELDYELIIRNLPINTNLDAKRRHLRNAFQNEQKDKTIVPGPYGISHEYALINSRVAQIETAALKQYNVQTVSRLIHSLYRTGRCQCRNEEEVKLKNDMMTRIQESFNECLKKTGTVPKNKNAQNNQKNGSDTEQNSNNGTENQGNGNQGNGNQGNGNQGNGNQGDKENKDKETEKQDKNTTELSESKLRDMVTRAIRDYFFALSVSSLTKEITPDLPYWFKPAEGQQSSGLQDNLSEQGEGLLVIGDSDSDDDILEEHDEEEQECEYLFPHNLKN